MNINSMCHKKTTFLEVFRNSNMASFLSESSRKLLASAFVQSRLDCCDSLLLNLPKRISLGYKDIETMLPQFCLTLRRKRTCEAKLRHLCCLPVKPKIKYETNVFSYDNNTRNNNNNDNNNNDNKK